MDEAEVEQFVEDMRAVDPDVVDCCDAFVLAMSLTATDVPMRYFGRVGDGTYYGDGDFAAARWFPNSTPMEAAASLRAEFGDDFLDELEQ